MTQTDVKTNTIKVGLVQIGELSLTRRRSPQWEMKNGIPIPKQDKNAAATYVYVPYSVGILQTYVLENARHPEQFEFLLPLFMPIPVEEAVEQLISADIVGFSAYVWNIELSLAIAAALKQRNPAVQIIFGGPQVPDVPDDFMAEHSYIDAVCHGEGERAFLSFLENSPLQTWELVPSISYRNAHGKLVTNPRADRIRDMQTIPSPFLNDTFKPLMDAYPQFSWLVTWETNRGCPFSCSFCDWGSAVASKVFRFDMERLLKEIEWFAANRINYLFVCDANFGIFPRDVELARRIVDVSKESGNHVVVSVQNTKNAKERSYEVQTILSEITTAGVTLSLQSVTPEVLKNIRRSNISLEAFHELQSRYMRDGISTYTDIILGLPGETYETFTAGVSQVLKNGQHNRIAFYNCSVLPNAEMGATAYQEKFGIKTRPVQIIHEHETVEHTSSVEVPEYLANVVETASMPGEDWVRTKAFTWFVELLHFNRLFQIPFVTMVERYDISYRGLFEAVINADDALFPLVASIREAFFAHARQNQAGKPEYMAETEYVGIWWPMHQFMFIKMVTDGQLDTLYEEIELIIARHVQSETDAFEPNLLRDAIRLNRSLVRLPFIYSDQEIELDYNIWEFYRSMLEGREVPIEPSPTRYRVNRTDSVWLTWDSWYEDIILRVYQREDYLYDVQRMPLQIAAEAVKTASEIEDALVPTAFD